MMMVMMKQVKPSNSVACQFHTFQCYLIMLYTRIATKSIPKWFWRLTHVLIIFILRFEFHINCMHRAIILFLVHPNEEIASTLFSISIYLCQKWLPLSGHAESDVCAHSILCNILSYCVLSFRGLFCVETLFPYITIRLPLNLLATSSLLPVM